MEEKFLITKDVIIDSGKDINEVKIPNFMRIQDKRFKAEAYQIEEPISFLNDVIRC